MKEYKTTEYYKNTQIPRTNNKIEGYFKITLPRHIKRKIQNFENSHYIEFNNKKINWGKK